MGEDDIVLVQKVTFCSSEDGDRCCETVLRLGCEPFRGAAHLEVVESALSRWTVRNSR